MMQQVLLTNHTHSPVTLWVPEECEIGDRFKWGSDIWKVTAIYSTLFPSSGTEVRRKERCAAGKTDYAFPLKGGD